MVSAASFGGKALENVIITGLLRQAYHKLGFLYSKFLHIMRKTMKNNFKNLHTISSLVFCSALLMISFTASDVLIIIFVMLACLIVFCGSGNLVKFRKGIIMFIPFSIVTITINLVFSQQGQTIIFHLGTRVITLEALLYSVMLSLKLLSVIYLFQILGIMINSDRAVSYFSGVMPKSTLMIMISFKLFPNMKKRIASLKEIYSIRGVNFEVKGTKDKVKSYISVLSILLEDSLEKSFDIGEAAYVRGFLSSKRSVYDRQSFKSMDWIIILTSIVLTGAYFLYTAQQTISLIVTVTIVFSILYLVLILIWRKQTSKDELYRD